MKHIVSTLAAGALALASLSAAPASAQNAQWSPAQQQALEQASYQWRVMDLTYHASVKCDLLPTLDRVAAMGAAADGRRQLIQAQAISADQNRDITASIKKIVADTPCDDLRADGNVQQGMQFAPLFRDQYLMGWNTYAEELARLIIVKRPANIGCGNWSQDEVLDKRPVFEAGEARLQAQPDFAQRKAQMKAMTKQLLESCKDKSLFAVPFSMRGMLGAVMESPAAAD